MDLKKVVNEVVEHSGGVDNIRSVVHCATRLRLELNDENKYDMSAAHRIRRITTPPII